MKTINSNSLRHRPRINRWDYMKTKETVNNKLTGEKSLPAVVHTGTNI